MERSSLQPGAKVVASYCGEMVPAVVVGTIHRGLDGEPDRVRLEYLRVSGVYKGKPAHFYGYPGKIIINVKDIIDLPSL